MTVKTTIAVTHILVTDYLVEGVYEEMGLCRSFELAQKMQAKKEAQYTPYIGRMHIVEVTAN